MRKSSAASLDTPITQMIDIVFLLIIFFVVTAAVDKDVVDETIGLAQARYSAAVETNDPRMVVLNLRKDGELNIAMQPLTLNQLQQLLIALRTQAGSSLPLLLRCDGEVQFRHIDRVMQVAASTGLYRVRISAEVQD